MPITRGGFFANFDSELLAEAAELAVGKGFLLPTRLCSFPYQESCEGPLVERLVHERAPQ